MRILIDRDPLLDPFAYQFGKSFWPAGWIGLPQEIGDRPIVLAFARSFNVVEETRVRVHVSADYRYELFLDGQRIGRGSEAGSLQDWFYESYEIPLSKGSHTIAARVRWLGRSNIVPLAGATVRPAFLLMAEGPLNESLSTGVAEWRVKELTAYKFDPLPKLRGFFAVGGTERLAAAQLDRQWMTGAGGGWTLAQPISSVALKAQRGEMLHDLWQIRPAILPAMLEEQARVGVARYVAMIDAKRAAREQPIVTAQNIAKETDSWNALLKYDYTLSVEARGSRRILIDLENYYCAYPQIRMSGGRGTIVRINWAESLFVSNEEKEKGNRDEIEGKFFVGMGDTIECDGSDFVFEPLNWRAGRYVELLITTAADALKIHYLQWNQVHYPYAFEHKFESSEPKYAEVFPLAIRTLEMCSHDTYMDCPYYERLMYAGDTRLEVLVTYCTTRDDSLPRKAVEMFDHSRTPSGLTQARTPTRIAQVIPPFSLWWIGMVNDNAMWRDDIEFVRARMPGVRAVVEAFARQINNDGLVESPVGWNFTDWVPAWTHGIPPHEGARVNGAINWQVVRALQCAAELESIAFEPELAARCTRLADRIAASASQAFFDEGRGILAEDLTKRHFSEHSQCLALLSDRLLQNQIPRVLEGLLTQQDLHRTTIYFTHYLFETLYKMNRMDAYFERLKPWFDLKGNGFRTTLEMPEPSRSDCHAWGAHPVYHAYASVLGIRPASAGFKAVRIQPRLGPLGWARGTMVHPRGTVSVDFKNDGGKVSGTIELPDGVSGVFVNGETNVSLNNGRQTV